MVSSTFPSNVTLTVLFGLFAVVVCQTNVTFNLSARNLPTFDIFDGAPDPYLILTLFNDNTTSPGINAGETDRPADTQNPDRTTQFTINYTGNSFQKIKFDLWDDDVDADDYMGYVEIRVADIVGAFGNILEVPFIGEASQGRLTIRANTNSSVLLS